MSDAMQGLQVELFGSLRCHKLHGWPLDRLVSQRTGIINQIRVFLLDHRGFS